MKSDDPGNYHQDTTKPGEGNKIASTTNAPVEQVFIHECNAWIKLDLHPHIVYCHYVREIDGIPSIFSEWMDGGSLKEAPTSGAGRYLYWKCSQANADGATG
jgi:hypothetical protein